VERARDTGRPHFAGGPRKRSAAIYCRLSKEDRDGRAAGVESTQVQETTATKVIEASGWTFVESFVDHGISPLIDAPMRGDRCVDDPVWAPGSPPIDDAIRGDRSVDLRVWGQGFPVINGPHLRDERSSFERWLVVSRHTTARHSSDDSPSLGTRPLVARVKARRLSAHEGSSLE
jgi:hypothetical protein